MYMSIHMSGKDGLCRLERRQEEAEAGAAEAGAAEAGVAEAEGQDSGGEVTGSTTLRRLRRSKKEPETAAATATLPTNDELMLEHVTKRLHEIESTAAAVFDEAAIRSAMIERFGRSKRPAGEPVLIPVLNESMPVTQTDKCSPAEVARRKKMVKVSVYDPPI